MNDATRRAALRRYLADRLGGERALLIQRAQLSKGRVAQLLDDGQPFGERAARSLEQKLNLPANFFDQPPRAANDEAPLVEALQHGEAELLRKWRLLIPEQQERVMGTIDMAAAHNQKAFEQLAAMKLDKFVPDGEVAKHLPPRPAQRELPIAGQATKKKPRR